MTGLCLLAKFFSNPESIVLLYIVSGTYKAQAVYIGGQGSHPAANTLWLRFRQIVVVVKYQKSKHVLFRVNMDFFNI